MSQPHAWTDDMKLAFASLHRDPKRLSFTEIARLMSETFGVELTRNACIGKARRMGLPMRSAPKVARKPVERKVRMTQLRRVDAPIAPVREPKPPEQAGLTIYETREGDCKWPLGRMHDHPPYLYCGDPSLLGRPYCAKHARKAAGQGTRS